ncbi:Ger(x)C family spore germination protein [Halobacillus locisalis]|uniref:Ger(X)C family spore germination protein n=1 Tax=Halobacillus locisalis TaxID=220753 RepID=A0A838CS59_9BACI|nr:Ger(x)C family spore germination protein [Halobacillus locisalis]MBA2174659.1 Ger(x)C family spore germination protein [Halobacillus locisalis]
MKKGLMVIISLVLLTGCWDERQFKNVKLVLTMGFDKGEDGGITETVSIPTIKRSAEGGSEEKVQIISTEARTPLEARNNTDLMVSESFDPAKLRVLVIGEELAKDNIYSVLDEFYRNPTNNLNAHIAIARGSASEVLTYQNTSDTRISKYISGLLQGAVATTHATGENIQLICAELFEEGEDFSLPIIEVDEEKQLLRFGGMALFHDDSYTGMDITANESIVFMLLQGLKGKSARLTHKVSDQHENERYNHVTTNVLKLKNDIDIKPEGDTVSVEVNLALKVRVVEYPADHLQEKKTIDELNVTLSEEVTKDAEKIVAKMQEANSDIWGIGRQVKAYHPEVYKKLKWSETFPEIDITPKVKVEIVQHGIIY